MKKRKSSPQTLKILVSLADAWPQWCYGYELSRETGLKSGTLYPILMRLSDRKWLESSWEAAPEQGRPRRHLYRLTAQGRKQVMAEIQPGFSSSGFDQAGLV